MSLKLANLIGFLGTCLCCLWLTPLWGGEGNLRFRNLTMEDGLSQSSVYAIAQDSLGYIWLGTFDGLNRFDGYSFKVFYHDSHDPDSLVHDWISDLAAGDDGQLWVGTVAGLDRYDPRTRRFHHYRAGPGARDLASDQITALLFSRSGLLFVGTSTGLQRLDPSTGLFTTYQVPPGAREDSSEVQALFEDGHDLWVGTKSGLLCYNADGKLTFRIAVGDEPGNLTGSVRALIRDGEGQLWIGTESGLECLNLASRALRPYRANGQPGAISSDVVRELLCDRDHRLWIATDKGLDRYDPKLDQFQSFSADPASPYSLCGDDLLALHLDQTGVLWIGAHGGISRWNSGSSVFHHYAHEANRPGLSESSVTAFTEDPEGRIWIGTHGGGVDRFDPVSGEFSHIGATPGGLLDDRIGSLLFDHSGICWIGTFSGLNRYDPRSRSFEAFRANPGNPEALASDGVTSILESRNNRYLYITAYRGGLHLLDLESRRIRQFRHDPRLPDSLPSERLITQLLDRRGQLWLGTNGAGICAFQESSGTFVSYHHRDDQLDSLSSDNAYCLHESERGDLWIGTHTGLNLWLEADRAAGLARFRHFTQREGLVDNLVIGILPGDADVLWISTGKGLSRLDTSDYSFRNFHAIHGIQPEFNAGAYFRSRDSRLYFGGTDGFNAFHSREIQPNPFPPKLVLEDLLLHNDPVVLGSADSPLKTDLQYQDEVTLDYHQNVFAIEFSGLHYIDPNKNRYAYKLDGLDDDWVQVDHGKRFASYTTLQPGRYRFHLKASNNDGVWSDERTLAIRVLPPPWRTWWAYALYLLVGLGVLAAYVAYQRRRLEAKQRLIEQLTKVDRLKDDFLANTSHELRTPLGGIIGLAESLLDGAAGSINETQARHLAMLVASGRRLSVLVDDILDFSKLRNAEVELQLKPVDIYTLVDVVLTLSKSTLGGKDLTLVNELDPNLPAVTADESRLVQILHNLVGNAVKFTERGTVTVAARQVDETLVISVRDTGIGIEPEDHARIFDSFQQLESANERLHGGAGLGLAITSHLVHLHGGRIWLESTPGSGSTFSFSLPLACSADEVRGLASGLLSSTRIQVPETELELGSFPTSVPASGTRFTILIVDDEPVNRQVLVNHLSTPDYQLLEASDGPEALAVVAARPVDLILLDIMMPRMSGYEVCRQLREQYHMHSLPIIFLTARNQLSDLATGFSSGANDYLTKPIAKKELVARVRTHLALLDITRTLEQRVAERTGELARRNEELRTLDSIVTTVNREFTLQRVLQVLLEQGMRFFENADKAAFVLLDHASQTFRVTAAVGHDPGAVADMSFGRDELIRRYTNDTEQVEPGVYLVRDVPDLPGRDLPRPECLLSMKISLEDQLEGFLVISNFSDRHAFDRSDVHKLVRFREHAVSALAKARMLEELQEKNKEIMRTQNQLILREKMVSLGTLTAGIAHEIRNPLNFINNFGVLNADLVHEGLELLRERGEGLDPLVLDHLREILQGLGENCTLIDKHGKKANHIVQSMMMLSRGAVGQREPYSINNLVEEYANLAYSGMVARGELVHLSFDRTYDEAVGRHDVVVADLGRVILSLVTNAIESLLDKQARARGFVPMLWISTKLEDHQVVIRIRDNGDGIPEAIRDKIFTPFFTTRQADNHIGLGLFISYDMVVQEHDGSLTLDSQLGEYCEFTIRLPA